ncbi:hypothetical protein HHX47_DHR5000288 [Lentinula edodes]|nr:hypothetical protein HHX47_DHR5000288 [Lentinula edodes]
MEFMSAANLLLSRLSPTTLMHALFRASISAGRSATISYPRPDAIGKILYGHSKHYSSPVISQDLPNSTQSNAHSAPFPSRTHTCGGLSALDAGSRVILTGWLLPERKGKLVSFFPLKDSFGTVQLIVNNSEQTREDLAALSKVPTESSVLVQGQVLLRPPSARRPGPTGEIDVEVEKFIVLNAAASDLPFTPSNIHNLPSEDLRLRYRFLDLRRTMLSDNLQKRSQVAHLVRNTLHDSGFVEIETPVLLRSSPEGAREFLVPTRTKDVSDFPAFYALQQSPQQPKQLLIASGTVDKYFQIAKCFRDEDGRKDRQPEFTQIDMEMAYVSWGPMDSIGTSSSGSQCSGTWRIGGSEVRDVVETIIKKIWKKIENFGSDKPDTRFGLEISEITPFVTPTQKALLEEKDEVLEAIIIRKSQEPGFWHIARKCEIDPLVESISITGKNAANWLQESNTVGIPTSAEVTESQCPDINSKLSISAGDTVWLARRSRVPNVRGQHYDLVLNGVEIGGGSVRVHDASLQEHIFTNVLQLSEQERAPFDQLLHALRCGAPPHGGIALGFDRLMSILCKTQSIRDVIAFPKTAGGADLLFKSPALVPPDVLEPYGLQPRNPEKASSSSS